LSLLMHSICVVIRKIKMKAKNAILGLPPSCGHFNHIQRFICGVFFLALLLFASVSTFASVYYVSVEGNDGNSGTEASPFRTIRKAVSKLQEGDVAYVRTGTYVESVWIGQSGTENAPVTLMAYPGESPVIDGQGWLPDEDWGALVQVEGNYVYVSGFEVKNSNTGGTHAGGAGVVCSGLHDKVSNMNVHHTWENGILVSGDYGIVENCRVWQCSLVNSAGSGSEAWSSGLSAARSPSDGITTDAIIRNNIVYDNWGEGLSTYEAEGTVIEDNIVYNNYTVNLYISDARNVLVQRNIVYNTDNNEVGQRAAFTLADELSSVPRSANNVIINNFLYNIDLWALWSTGVPGSGLDNVMIAYNTLVNGQLEIGNAPADVSIIRSGVIKNNIFISDLGDPWEVKGSLDNLSMSNNFWSSPPPDGLAGDGDQAGDPQLARTGGTGAGELTADYFRLLEASPAIDHGTVLSDVTYDFFENFRGNSPDMGAHEYITADQAIPVSDIQVIGNGGATEITSKEGTLQLYAYISPENATYKTVSWSLQNNSGQASISATGLVTALDDGIVTAIATATDGSFISSNLDISITGQSLPTGGNDDTSQAAWVTLDNETLIVSMKDPAGFQRLDMYNTLGNPVIVQDITDNSRSIDISALVPGVYIVLLSGAGEVWKTKVVIP
jgi:parallel beta-helix repeat protein